MAHSFQERCAEIIDEFPRGICFAFAYGSGVFKQAGHKSTKDNMIDFIFVVNNPLVWHQRNIQKFPGHYSFLRTLGPRIVSSIQQSDIGARVYFNTLVNINGSLIKYGVVSKFDLIDDLINWNKVYLAGRLHKPVLPIINSPSDVTIATESNIRSAMETALLLLPEKFTDKELFLTLAGLSYQGDFRMVVGEDRKKVENIVEPNMEHFHALYSPVYLNMDTLSLSNSVFKQCTSKETTLTYLLNLPLSVKANLKDTKQDLPVEEALSRLACSKQDAADTVAAAVSSIVLRSSITQSLKGILTAGVTKTIKYSSTKLFKMVKGFLR